MSTVSELTAKFIEVLDAKDVQGLRAIGLGDVSFVTADFDGSSGKDFVEYLGKWTDGLPGLPARGRAHHRRGNTRVAYSWVFRGTNTGPLKTDAGELPATGKAVEVTLLGTAVWDGDKLKEMYMVWDQLLMMQQLGLT